MRALESMRALGLSKDFVQLLPAKDTGTARVTTDELGNANFSIKRPAAFDEIQIDGVRLSAIEALRPEWIPVRYRHFNLPQNVYDLLSRVAS